MVNICFISAQYLPNMGGVENYTYNLAKQLTKLGIHVTIISMNNNNVLNFECNENIEVYRLPCFNLMNGRFPVPKFSSQYRKLRKQIDFNKFDFFIINTRFYILSLMGTYWSTKYKKRSILIEHGTQHLTMGSKGIDSIIACYEHVITWLIRFIFHGNYYGVSKACNEWSEHFKIKATGVLYNSVDIERINEIINSNNHTFRKKHQIPNDAKVISFTGRLMEEKGILNLVDAFKVVNKEFPNTYLYIAGAGDLDKRILALNHPNIIYLGRITFEEVITFLNESDIFCLPSRSEGLPTSVLEAVACKNFIITTKQGGAKELIKSKEYGIILDDNETSKIVNSLKYVLNNFEYMNSAIELSYTDLINNFSWKSTANKLKSIIDDESA